MTSMHTVIMVISMPTMQSERNNAVWATLSRLLGIGARNVKADPGAGGRGKKRESERSIDMSQPEARIPYDIGRLRGSGGVH